MNALTTFQPSNAEVYRASTDGQLIELIQAFAAERGVTLYEPDQARVA